MFSDLLYKIVGLKKGNTVNAQVSVSKFIFLVKFFRLSEFTQTQMLVDLTAVHY